MDHQKIMDSMNLHDRAVYEKKLQQRHTGPCSSRAAAVCPCTNACPLHGRCCDCLRHHKEEGAGRAPDDFSWIPNCLKMLNREK